MVRSPGASCRQTRIALVAGRPDHIGPAPQVAGDHRGEILCRAAHRGHALDPQLLLRRRQAQPDVQLRVQALHQGGRQPGGAEEAEPEIDFRARKSSHRRWLAPVARRRRAAGCPPPPSGSARPRPTAVRCAPAAPWQRRACRSGPGWPGRCRDRGHGSARSSPSGCRYYRRRPAGSPPRRAGRSATASRARPGVRGCPCRCPAYRAP